MKPFTVAALAERWTCSPQTIRNMVNDGSLPAIRYGRMIRIPFQIVEEIEQCGLSDTEASGLSASTADASQPGTTPDQNIVVLPNGRHVQSSRR